MATQINVLDAGTDAAMSLLVALMAILAMLGIVANVAWPSARHPHARQRKSPRVGIAAERRLFDSAGA